MSVNLNVDPSRLAAPLLDKDPSVTDTTALQQAKKAGVSNTTDIPDIDQGFNLSSLSEKPSLKAPIATIGDSSMSMAALSTLGTEAIMSLLGFEERTSAVNSGKASIEAHREEREAVNQQRIEKLQEQAEKLEKKGLLDTLKKAFSIIGCVLGAIASIGAAVIGGITGNPLMVIGAAMVMVTVVDQAVQLGTDGEKGIVQAIVAQAEKDGNDTKAASIAAQVMMLCIGIVGSLFSGGLGSSNLGAATQVFTTATNAANGFNMAASGATQIASSVVDYKIENLRADGKELEAILMRIQMASEIDTQQIKDIMDRASNMAQAVNEILNSCNQSLRGVLTANAAPAMA